jgi:hypothetical protein
MLWLGTQHLEGKPFELTDVLGFIPEFISELDPRPAREQIADNYCGGWRPMRGMARNPITSALTYPGDPPMVPLATARLRDEIIYVYESGWTAIVQPDGSFEVSRLD